MDVSALDRELGFLGHLFEELEPASVIASQCEEGSTTSAPVLGLTKAAGGECCGRGSCWLIKFDRHQAFWSSFGNATLTPTLTRASGWYAGARTI
jgi:hypothetical protein